MSTQNVWDGSVYLTPDMVPGYGQLISSPATVLSDMVTNQYYMQEVGGDVDVVFLAVESTNGFLISLFKSFTNQKLLNSFVARSSFVGGQHRIRWISRSLCTTFSMEQALRACGVNVSVSDDYSDMATINMALAPFYLQIFKAP